MRESYFEAAIADEVRKVVEARPGARNSVLNAAAYWLATLGIEERIIRSELTAAAERCGLVKDSGAKPVQATIASGLKAGYAKPRQLPRQNGFSYRPQPSPSPRESRESRSSPFPRPTPEKNGKPRFIVAGDDGPPRESNELRRHVYRRDDVPVRIKLKYKDQKTGKPSWSNWYRVRSDDGALGWQAAKPDGYRDVPYVTHGSNPFDQEVRRDALCWPEGEKDVDTITRLGGLAFTFGGTGDGLSANAAEYLAQRNVVIPVDNDQGGRDHAQRKAALAHPVAKTVKVIEFPGLPEHGDVSDWIAQAHTFEELSALAEATPLWSPPAMVEDKQHHRAERKAINNTEPGTLESARASTFVMRAVRWFWFNRFALGKIGLIGGLPDRGKGLIMAHMVARATRGDSWPCNEGCAIQGNVIELSAEDDIEDTVVPRLAAAGADLERIHIVKMVRQGDNRRMFNLATDLALLKAKIKEIGGVVLIVIDPLSAYLGVGKVDSYRTTDVRGVLAPLKELAEETMIAIIGVMHFNKKTDVNEAMLRIADSLAYVAASRHCYVVIDDPENERRLFVKAKNNLAPDMAALSYTVDTIAVGKDPDSGTRIYAPYVIWGGDHVTITATEAMQAEASAKSHASPSARDTAKQFLTRKLAMGPVPKREIDEEADANCISQRTLERAKTELGVTVRKGGFKGGWLWELTTQPQPRRDREDY